MKLLFEDRYGRYKEVADVSSHKEAATAIQDFLDAHNFKSYYTRMWIQEHEDQFQLMFDVGSHTEFFCIRFDTHEAAEAFIKDRN